MLKHASIAAAGLVVGATLTSACRMETSVRRRNWPDDPSRQDTAAVAAFAPAPSHPCGWMSPPEIAELTGMAPSRPPQPRDAGCFYPLRGDSAGVAITVRLLAEPGMVRSAGWNEDVTRLSPAAFAGRSGTVHIEVADVGGVLTSGQVRAIAQRVLDRNRVRSTAAAPAAPLAQDTSPAPAAHPDDHP